MAENTGKSGNTAKRLSLYAKDYVVFDLETTGLSPRFDEIIEISGIRVREHKAAEEFATLVNPGMHIPPAATKVNGITDKMVQDAPLLKEALEQFLAFAGGDILVGHNIHTFDMHFLNNGALRELGRTISNDYVDTLYLARNCLPQLSHHRLTDVAEHFCIETEGAHRALNDCAMNQQCYEKLREIWEKRTAESSGAQPDGVCPICGSVLVKRKGRYGEFWGCGAFPQCRFTAKLVIK